MIDALVMAMFAALGAVVTRKRPTNPVGWILCVIPVSLGRLLLSSHLYESLSVDHPDAFATALAAWFASWVWIPFAFPALTLFPLSLPDRTAGHSALGLGDELVVAALPVSFVGVASCPARSTNTPVANPRRPGRARGPGRGAGVLGFAMMLVATVAAAASLVVRFRRSREKNGSS